MSEQAPETQPATKAENTIEAAIKAMQGEEQPVTAEPKPPEAQAAAPSPTPAPEPDKDLDEIKKLLAQDNKVSKVKRETSEARTKAIEELKAKASTDKLALLRELGINPQEFVADVLMNSRQEEKQVEYTPEVAALRDELDKIRGALSEREQREQSSYIQAQQREAIVSAKQFVLENQEKYEMINSSGDQGAKFLVDVLVAKYNENRDYYIENNTAPSFQDVAEGVEKYMIEQAKQQLAWMAKQKKLLPLINEFAGKPALNKPQTPPTQKRSLDNDATAEGADNLEPKTDAERVQLAIRQLTASGQ